MRYVCLTIMIFACMTFAQTTRTIDVTGKCSLSVNPDIVYFLVDIETIDSTLEGAKTKNDKVFFDLLASLKKTGEFLSLRKSA